VVHRDGSIDEIRQCWRTPPDLAVTLIERHGITLDVAAHRGNAIVPTHLGPGSPIATDATTVAWGYHAPRCTDGRTGAAFCNPPFRRARAFVQAGIAAVTHHGRPIRAVVFLLPVNLDTRWARLLWEHGATIYAIHGRLRFASPVDEDGAPIEVDTHNGAAFPMMIAVLDRASRDPRRLHLIDTAGRMLEPRP
jgi:phage N-6-adenine-methyltransferase